MSEAKIKVSAQDNASIVLANIRNSMDAASRSAAQLGSVLGLAGALSVSGLAVLARDAINSVDALNDLKDATGSSIENLSALEDVAARTGTSFDTVGTALVKFNAQLKDAKPGSGAEQALTALGLSVKDLQALDPAEALLKTSIALEGFADDANKARLVQELFGKSIKEVAPLLKDLAEKGKLVATVTTEQAKAAEDFNKELFALGKNATDASRSLTIDLVIGINKAAKALRESGLVEGFRTLFTGDDQYKNDVKLTDQTNELLELEKDVVELRSSGAAIDAASARKKEERLKVLREELQVTQNYRKVLSDLGVKQPEPPKPILPVVDGEALKKSQREREKAAKEELERIKREQEERIRLNRAVEVSVGDAVNDRNEAYQKLIQDQEKASASYLNGLAKELQALEESNQKQREQLQEIGLTKEELNALTLARLDDALATERSTLAIANAMGQSQEEIGILERKIALLKDQRDLTAKGQVKQAAADTKSDQDKASKDYADTLRGDLKGAFSAAFRDSESPLQAFGNALENVMFTRASTALADALLGSGTAGGNPGLLAGLFSFDGGGYTGNASRSGGLDGKGGFMAMLHPQESIIDHTKGQSTGGGGSGGSVTVNIIESPGNGGKSVQRTEGGVNIIDVMVEKIKGAIATDIASGNGAVPSAMAATYGLNRVAGAY